MFMLNKLIDRLIEVDDVSLRFRTSQSFAHLLTSSSRHVTSDMLTIAVSDGRITVDIRTAADHKVCAFCLFPFHFYRAMLRMARL